MYISTNSSNFIEIIPIFFCGLVAFMFVVYGVYLYVKKKTIIKNL